jgi:hypothetical protein
MAITDAAYEHMGVRTELTGPQPKRSSKYSYLSPLCRVAHPCLSTSAAFSLSARRMPASAPESDTALNLPQLDQPLAIEWPRQGLLWLGGAYGAFALLYIPWRTRVRQRERNHTQALMRGMLQTLVMMGQIGGLVGICLLLGDFPYGDYQGQQFSSYRCVYPLYGAC